MTVLLTETVDHITTVTLNRPESLNALSLELRAAIRDTFHRLRDDTDTRVIILTGAGRAFCAGLDLKEMGQPGLSITSDENDDFHRTFTGVGKPVIAAINGVAVTGGFELALMCDILIASTAARFADTHVHVGVLPGWGLSQRLSRLVGVSRAKEISLTGNYLDAETAERWGLVNRVLPADELLPYCRGIASDMVSADAAALDGAMRLIDFGWQETLRSGLAHEAHTNRNYRREALERREETPEERRERVTRRGREQLSTLGK